MFSLIFEYHCTYVLCVVALERKRPRSCQRVFALKKIQKNSRILLNPSRL